MSLAYAMSHDGAMLAKYREFRDVYEAGVNAGIYRSCGGLEQCNVRGDRQSGNN